jgi:4-aminobutyrate aminotransferase/(S)-3-amino-2-methylpropionate transaminase
VIGEIRADRGAMIAIELVKDGDAAEPDASLTKSLVGLAPQKGLILLSCGVNGNVIRLLPPLTISDEMLDEGLEILADCLKSLL